jgi:hypothetical protein
MAKRKKKWWESAVPGSTTMGVGAGPGMGFRATPATLPRVPAGQIAGKIGAGLSNLGRYAQNAPQMAPQGRPRQTLTEGVFGASGPVQRLRRMSQSARDFAGQGRTRADWAGGTLEDERAEQAYALLGGRGLPTIAPPSTTLANTGLPQTQPQRTRQDILDEHVGVPGGYAQAGVRDCRRLTHLAAGPDSWKRKLPGKPRGPNLAKQCEGPRRPKGHFPGRTAPRRLAHSKSGWTNEKRGSRQGQPVRVLLRGRVRPVRP